MSNLFKSSNKCQIQVDDVVLNFKQISHSVQVFENVGWKWALTNNIAQFSFNRSSNKYDLKEWSM